MLVILDWFVPVTATSSSEKQNQELQAQLQKQQGVADLDLQAKCSRDVFLLNAGAAAEIPWTNDMTVYDVYENINYGHFAENHYTYYKPTISTRNEMLSCEVWDKKCKGNAGVNSWAEKRVPNVFQDWYDVGNGRVENKNKEENEAS